MTEAQTVAFLEALRAKNIYVKDNGWVIASCPLAQWLHKSHADHTPSFALSVTPGGRSHFLCFACRQGSAEELLSMLELYSHVSKDYDFARCHHILAEEEYVVPLPEYGEFIQKAQVFDAWPQFWLESFKKVEWEAEPLAYLHERGVYADIITSFDIRFDTKRQMIVAPYYDVFGRLAGARGRSIYEDSHLKHYDYSWQGSNNAKLCWYNEMVLNDPGPIVVVEGQFDCWRTVQAFHKTVANLTAKPTLEKMKKLSDCGVVIQIPDRDDAGAQSVERYGLFCRQLGLEHRVVWLDEGCKDPADCSVDYLKDKIQDVCN